MPLSPAERQRKYRKAHRSETHDNCSECGKEKMNWAKVCVSCTKKKLVADKNHIWKGDNVGYRCLHLWVVRQLGKPNFCEQCRNGKLRPRQYHWANLSHLYKRDLKDWKRMCVKCHKKYDKEFKYSRDKEYKLTELPKSIMAGEIL